MKDETPKWLEYADENLASAKVLLDSKLFSKYSAGCRKNAESTTGRIFY